MIPFTNARLRRTLLATAALVIFAGSSTFNTAAATIPLNPTFVSTLTTATRLSTQDVILGRMNASQSVPVTISLKLRNQDKLDAFLATAAQPGTPVAQRTLTPAQFTAQFSPTVAQANGVAQYLRDSGFTNVSISTNRMLVSGDAPASTVQTTFHTTLSRVQTADGRQAFANTEAVQIPAALQDTVLAVLGLQTVHQYHTFAHAVPMSSSGHNPTEFSSIYGGSGVPTGAGVTVGIISQGSLTNVLSDLQKFTSQNGLASVQTQVINVNGTSSDIAGDGEWDLDSQDIVGMAGGQIGKLIFYNIPNLSNANLTHDFNRVVTDNVAKIINVSLGECETAAQQDGSAATDDQLFQQGISQGQTFSISTGDSGADECNNGGITPSYPASSPNVIAAAGTLLNASTTTWNGETVWTGSGGSESTFQPRPSWQTLWTGNYRGVADIAFDGDPNSGSLVIVGGQTQQIGGTSLSAPLFAGLWARMIAAKGTSIGFAGPQIYQLPQADFHDVTSGNNGGSTAKVGYDLASGRGSMIMSKVLADLGGGSSGGGNTPPTAGFSDTVNNLTASFTDGSSDSDGSIAARAWSFGDGNTSTATNPSHTYASAGTYSVKLTVTDNDGATNSVTHSVTVSAANQAPTAAFTVTTNGLAASFSDGSSDSDGSIASRSWNFGDSHTSTAKNPSHTYASAGTYSVKLTVTDNDGATDSVTHSVTVSSSTPPPGSTPVAAVSPSSLSFSVEAGASGSNALTIGNTGTANLTFNIAEGPHTNAVPTSYKTASERKQAGGATTMAFAPVSITRSVTAGNGMHGLAVVVDTATSISEMADNTPGTGGVSCSSSSNTSDNSWWRRFDFSEFASVGNSAAISSVTISSGNGSANNVPITINLYTINHNTAADTISTSGLTLIGSGTGTINSGEVSLTVPVNGTVSNTAGKDLVVEYHTDGTNNGRFEPGANSSAETHPSFISSSACSITQPETGSQIGFPNFHLTMVVNLDSSTAPVTCQNVQDIPWLSESPASGTVAAGNSTNVSVTSNASGLSAGNYSADVCVSTNDVTQPVITVPVSLEVTASPCSIAADGDIFHSGFESAPSLNGVQACGPPPSGNIVLSGPLNWNITNSSGGSALDFLLKTNYSYSSSFVDDLNLYSNGGYLTAYWYGDQVSGNVGGVVGRSGNVKVLHSGASIGPASTISSASKRMSRWTSGKTGYLGIAFYNEDTGQVDYGYVHLQTSGSKGYPATVLDYAYDADGNAITIP